MASGVVRVAVPDLVLSADGLRANAQVRNPGPAGPLRRVGDVVLREVVRRLTDTGWRSRKCN